MRIALVVAGGLDRSGRERVTPALLWLVERLAARFDLTAYVLRHHDRPVSYRLRGATVHDLGSPHGVHRQYAALLAALRRDGGFAVMHAYMGQPSGLTAALAGRRLGIPTIVTLDSGEFVGLADIDYGLQLHLKHRVGLRIVRRLASRFTVCSYYQEILARHHGFPASVIPLGIDLQQFVSGTERSAGPPWRLIHVASLNRVKDQTTLLEAFGQLTRDGLDAHLDLIGEDTLNGSIQRVARSLSVTGRVTFHGFLPTALLVPFYQRAHLNVLSSRHEAACVSVLEAAACGLATVGTRVGYLADWTPARSSTVVPRDSMALAHAIRGVLRDPARRMSLASAAAAWTRSHDADWTADQFAELYQQAATGRAHRL
jgi:glycosyltransferase involved in cell wall biosynthesis